MTTNIGCHVFLHRVKKKYKLKSWQRSTEVNYSFKWKKVLHFSTNQLRECLVILGHVNFTETCILFVMKLLIWWCKQKFAIIKSKILTVINCWSEPSMILPVCATFFLSKHWNDLIHHLCQKLTQHLQDYWLPKAPNKNHHCFLGALKYQTCSDECWNGRRIILVFTNCDTCSNGVGCSYMFTFERNNKHNTIIWDPWYSWISRMTMSIKRSTLSRAIYIFKFG